jgi:hypothetical protein
MLDVTRARAFHEEGKEESGTTCSIAQQVSLSDDHDECNLSRPPSCHCAGAHADPPPGTVRTRLTLLRFEAIRVQVHSIALPFLVDPSELAYQNPPLTRARPVPKRLTTV